MDEEYLMNPWQIMLYVALALATAAVLAPAAAAWGWLYNRNMTHLACDKCGGEVRLEQKAALHLAIADAQVECSRCRAPFSVRSARSVPS